MIHSISIFLTFRQPYDQFVQSISTCMSNKFQETSDDVSELPEFGTPRRLSSSTNYSKPGLNKNILVSAGMFLVIILLMLVVFGKMLSHLEVEVSILLDKQDSALIKLTQAANSNQKLSGQIDTVKNSINGIKIESSSQIKTVETAPKVQVAAPSSLTAENQQLKLSLRESQDMVKTLSVQIDIKRKNQNIIRTMITQSVIKYDQGAHYFDNKLMKLLTDYYSQQGAKSVVDFGCGKCDYILQLAKQGYDVQGYDGTPYSDNPLIKQMDLSKQTNLGRKFDFVQSFEVGEHIYSDLEDNFISTLATHATKGIVMSWSVVGQWGFLHVNNRDNAYVIEKMKRFGWTYNKVKADQFKNTFDNHFHRSIMVFSPNN